VVTALLALWCVLALAPALIIAVFVGVDIDNPSAAVLVLWLVGYLAQIGVFLVITVKSSSANVAGWMIASLVPWTANWAAPISPWWLVGCAAVVVGYSLWFHRSQGRLGTA
jgi:hypothetical protein